MLKKICYSALLTVLLSSAAFAGTGVKAHKGDFSSVDPSVLAAIETAGGAPQTFPRNNIDQDVTGFAGAYLSSHHAQMQNDWLDAYFHLEDVLSKDPENPVLLQRAMVLAMGAGRPDMAAKRATDYLQYAPDDKLALIILSVDALASGDNDAALDYLRKMPNDDIASYLKPLMLSWAEAGEGKLDVDNLRNVTRVHDYHAALIAIYLHKDDVAMEFAKSMISEHDINVDEAMRAADLFAWLGNRDQALVLYKGAYAQQDKAAPDGVKAAQMIKLLEDKSSTQAQIKTALPQINIKRPAEGVADVIYDLAFLMLYENNLSSARLFAYMVMDLTPDMDKARLLLADTMAQSGRVEDAIINLTHISKDNPVYIEAQRHAAELLADAGRYDEAREQLNNLFLENNDIDALIRIGDTYRSQDNYKDALTAYNRAAEHLGKKIPEKYWNLLYARGMAYDRVGQWDKAEADFKAALEYRPNHPYILNYLGYGWAERGEKLDESLNLVKKAVMLQPTDGYIVDTLGWVNYMKGDYQNAILSLERAVELLPYDPTVNEHLGDAYWQVGRKMEARFQWHRAMNYAQDSDEKLDETHLAALKTELDDKIANGLPADAKKPHAKIEQASNTLSATDTDSSAPQDSSNIQ